MNNNDSPRILSFLFCVLVLLQGCVSTTHSMSNLTAPQTLAELSRDERAFQINDVQSQVLIEVDKAGTQSQLGHVHLLRVHKLEGLLYLNSVVEKSRIYMQFPVAAIEVDNDQLREQAGEKYAKPVREKDKLATYNNMVSDKVLSADLYPTITMESVNITRSSNQHDMTLKLEVLNRVTTVNVPLVLEINDHQVCAKGTFLVNQTDLGITPLSVFMGAIKVADELIVHFDVCADS